VERKNFMNMPNQLLLSRRNSASHGARYGYKGDEVSICNIKDKQSISGDMACNENVIN